MASLLPKLRGELESDFSSPNTSKASSPSRDIEISQLVTSKLLKKEVKEEEINWRKQAKVSLLHPESEKIVKLIDQQIAELLKKNPTPFSGSTDHFANQTEEVITKLINFHMGRLAPLFQFDPYILDFLSVKKVCQLALIEILIKCYEDPERRKPNAQGENEFFLGLIAVLKHEFNTPNQLVNEFAKWIKGLGVSQKKIEECEKYIKSIQNALNTLRDSDQCLCLFKPSAPAKDRQPAFRYFINLKKKLEGISVPFLQTHIEKLSLTYDSRVFLIQLLSKNKNIRKILDIYHSLQKKVQYYCHSQELFEEFSKFSSLVSIEDENAPRLVSDNLSEVLSSFLPILKNRYAQLNETLQYLIKMNALSLGDMKYPQVRISMLRYVNYTSFVSAEYQKDLQQCFEILAHEVRALGLSTRIMALPFLNLLRDVAISICKGSLEPLEARISSFAKEFSLPQQIVELLEKSLIPKFKKIYEIFYIRSVDNRKVLFPSLTDESSPHILFIERIDPEKWKKVLIDQTKFVFNKFIETLLEISETLRTEESEIRFILEMSDIFFRQSTQHDAVLTEDSPLCQRVIETIKSKGMYDFIPFLPTKQAEQIKNQAFNLIDQLIDSSRFLDLHYAYLKEHFTFFYFLFSSFPKERELMGEEEINLWLASLTPIRQPQKQAKHSLPSAISEAPTDEKPIKIEAPQKQASVSDEPSDQMQQVLSSIFPYHLASSASEKDLFHYNQVYHLDHLKWTWELLRLLIEAKNQEKVEVLTAAVVSHVYHIFELSLTPQILTRFPKEVITHGLARKVEKLKMKEYSIQALANNYGTFWARYPHSSFAFYQTRRLPIPRLLSLLLSLEKGEVDWNTIGEELERVIHQAIAFQEETAKENPFNLRKYLLESNPVSAHSSIKLDVKSISKILFGIEEMIKSLASVKVEKNPSSSGSYKDALAHLKRLKSSVELAYCFPSQRYVSFHERQIISSLQLFIEQITRSELARQGKLTQTHDLNLLIYLLNLDDSLNGEELQAVADLNIFKGVDYPYWEFTKHDGPAVGLIRLGNSYQLSKIATEHGEGFLIEGKLPKINPEKHYQEIVDLLSRGVPMIEKIVKLIVQRSPY